MNDVTRCSFCGRKLDEVSRLVRSGPVVICLACARQSVEIMQVEDASPISRFPRSQPQPVVNRVAPDTRHLDGFLHYSRGGILTGTPEPLMPWLREFLDTYETAVLDAVREAARYGDSIRRSQVVSAAFDRMMLPYRGDQRRAYLGAVFDKLLGRSIREGFAYHVDMTVLSAPAEVALCGFRSKPDRHSEMKPDGIPI